MALADPQSVDIDGAISLARVGFGQDAGKFSSADGQTTLSLAHAYGRRTRRNIRLDHSIIAPDPLISAQNIRHSMACYLVVDTPVTGFTPADAKLVVEGLTGLLAASSGAALLKFLQGES